MIRFDIKNSVNKSIFIKAMQYSSAQNQYQSLFEGKKDSDQHLILSALKEIEHSNEKNAVGLVNALFLSSTSHALDKVCLNIFSRLGDEKSLQLLYKKYPTPESISISLLPFYVKAIGFIGEAKEIELLAKVTNTFWGLYRSEVLRAFEQISERIGKTSVSDAVVTAMQNLYETGDEADRRRIISLCAQYDNELLLGVFLCAIESQNTFVRKAAIPALGALESLTARASFINAFRKEDNDELLETYEAWLFESGTDISTFSPPQLTS